MERSRTTTLAAPAAPRPAALWATAVYVLAALTVAWPALAGRFLVNLRSDQYLAGYAFREYGASVLKTTGGFAEWNPYLFGGMPYIAAMHGDIFYPTFLLRLLLPTDVAMTWGLVLHVMLAGVFTYLFLRAMSVGFWPALIGGLVYELSGPVISLVSPGHDGQLFVSALLPLTLLFVLRATRDNRRWAWGAIALVVGLGMLTPHPTKMQYLLLLSGAFGLYLLLGGEGEKLPRRVAVRRGALALGMVALGFAIAAVQYWPLRQYVPWSPRAGGRSYEFATAFALHTPDLFNTFLPQFAGMLENYWGANGFHYQSEYLGASMFVLAFAGLGSAMRRRGSRLFWLGALVVGTLWALGSTTPFYRLVYALVPGAKYTRTPDMMFFVPAFSFAVLASYGAERALAGRVRGRYLVGWVAGVAVVALLGAAGGLTNVAGALAEPELYDRVLANAGNVAAGAWRTFAAVSTLALVLWLYSTRRLAASAAAMLVATVAVVDLWSVARHYWSFSEPAARIYARDPIIDYLIARRDSSRVVSFPLRNPEGYHDPFFVGDAFMTYRIRQLNGYHGNELGRYETLAGEDNRQVANPNYWRLTNLQYVYTNVDSFPIPGARRLLGPVTNSAGSTSYLFRLPGDNPPAWVATAIVKASDEQALATLWNPLFNVASAALFDSAAVGVTARTDLKVAPTPSPLRVAVTRPTSSEIRATLDRPAPAGSALIVSENYYPGWAATVDGEPGTTARVDVTMIGVPLPEGARQVVLTFHDRAYGQGKVITLLAGAAAIGFMIFGAITERRRRRD